MNILLIDNGTLHIDELQEAVNNNNVKTITREQLPLENLTNIDLIILSGSSDNAVVTHPDVYKYEIKLIRESNIPIIGICMGFEVIAYAFGATLTELPQKEHGIVDIIVTHNDPIFDKNKYYNVMENHRWVVTKIKEPLVELAISKDGIEALKHKEKPIYGFQFHPEIVSPKNSGIEIFYRLLKTIGNM